MIEIFVGALTGIIASLGLGGGFVLIIYLVNILDIEQSVAQGVNLLFFIPVALLSLYFHTKNKMVEWKIVPKLALTGIIGAVLGAIIALNLENKYLRLIFAVFLIIIGIKELFEKS